MAVYKRGRTYWYKFKFCGRDIRESAKTTVLDIARKAERNRRRELEESYNGITRRPEPKLFTVAADEWLELKKPLLAPKSYGIEQYAINHLRPYFGKRLLTDIDANAITRYVSHRRSEGAADKSIKLEIGTLRGILKRAKLWAHVREDDELMPKLHEREDAGRALSAEEETALLAQCGQSRSRALWTAVELALNTGMRESEVRLLRWRQIDFEARTVTVGKSKTAAGTGRVIPLNDRATAALRFWSNQFPKRQPTHYVFPSEAYGNVNEETNTAAHHTDPRKPILSWKTGWANAREAAGVECRFHDLRHTAVTRMLERGVAFPVVASLLGWSPSTTVKMAKRYGHIGNAAHREAVAALDRSAKPQENSKSATA